MIGWGGNGGITELNNPSSLAWFPTTDEVALARAFMRARSSDIASAAIEVTGAYLDNCR